MRELFAQGGFVLAGIVAVSTAAWAVVVSKAIGLRRGGGAGPRGLGGGGVAGRRPGETPAGLEVVAVMAGVCLLLGLLGTVLGMRATFAAVTAGGRVDPARLAAGVSKALVTTQAGLVTAVPLVVAHAALRGRAARRRRPTGDAAAGDARQEAHHV